MTEQWRRNEFETGEALVQRESGGTDPARSAGKQFLVVSLHFLALKVQLVVLASTFVMVSTVWSVSCLLFFYLRCPRAQPFVKVGAHAYGVSATVTEFSALYTSKRCNQRLNFS